MSTLLAGAVTRAMVNSAGSLGSASQCDAVGAELHHHAVNGCVPKFHRIGKCATAVLARARPSAVPSNFAAAVIAAASVNTCASLRAM